MTTRRYKAHPQSAPGDFYVVNDECIACGAPHAIAPDLIGWAENVGDYTHCIWKRQPQTAEEVEDAIGVVLVSEVACHRYAGEDQEIIDRLGPDYCDTVRRSRPADVPVNRDPLSPPTFALIATGTSPFYRMIAALRSMASRLFRKG